MEKIHLVLNPLSWNMSCNCHSSLPSIVTYICLFPGRAAFICSTVGFLQLAFCRRECRRRGWPEQESVSASLMDYLEEPGICSGVWHLPRE